MSVVLVVNSGSSSFKYQLIDMDNEAVLASGLVRGRHFPAPANRGAMMEVGHEWLCDSVVV